MSGSRLSKRTRRVGTQRLLRGQAYAALASLVVIGISISGCGADGTSIVGPGAQPQQVSEKITGIVSAPNGEIVLNRSWWELPHGLGLISPAYALKSPPVSPVGARLPVALVLVDPVDALNGQLDEDPKHSSLPLLPAALTESDGRYTFIAKEAEDVAVCRKMVEVGTGETLTRAFVYVHSEVNIDASSEALVRVVLDRIASSTAGLCDFDVDTLTKLAAQVTYVTQFVSGDSVAAINDAAYQAAKNSPLVQVPLMAVP